MSSAVRAIPYALSVLRDILIHRMPLSMIQHAHFSFGLGVCGHFHVAYLLSALFALPFIPIDGTLSAGFTKGAHLCCLSEFSRGLVEVFLIAPFHGGNRSTE